MACICAQCSSQSIADCLCPEQQSPPHLGLMSSNLQVVSPIQFAIIFAQSCVCMCACKCVCLLAFEDSEALPHQDVAAMLLLCPGHCKDMISNTGMCHLQPLKC